MSQYLLSVWHPADFEYDVDFSTPEMQELAARVGAFNEKVMAAGQWVFGGGLMPPSSATALRADGTNVSMTDGPYAESKEMMGGFWVLELPDFETALEVAKEAAIACGDAVELRPFQGE